MVQPFSVFKRADRPAYLVAFKNEVTGRYLPAVSTRKEKYADAVKQAWAWYREGIPRKDGPVDVPVDSIRRLILDTPLTGSDADSDTLHALRTNAPFATIAIPTKLCRLWRRCPVRA